MADAVAGGLGATGIARQQDHARSLVGKNFGNRLPNSHGGPGDDHDFPVHLHGDPCIARRASKSMSVSSQFSVLSSQWEPDDVRYFPRTENWELTSSYSVKSSAVEAL